MKKIVFVGFLFALCFNVFSQDAPADSVVIEKLKIRYDKAKTMEEKLDLIFKAFRDKQIFDYKENTRLNDLESNKNTLDSKISSLEISINKKDKEISKLNAKNQNLKQLKQGERNRVQDEIKEIFENRELISEALLNITKKRALDYQLDAEIISDLNSFIDITKKGLAAQELLFKRINTSEVEGQLNILNNIRAKKFKPLSAKIQSLILLLEEYCNKSQDLFEQFEIVDSRRYTDSKLKDLLEESHGLFISYPFLFNEITKKLNDINYKSQIEQCF